MESAAAGAGVSLIITAQLLKAGVLNATTQTLCWTVVFFFASAGASAGYLTVSEVFFRAGAPPTASEPPSSAA